MGLHNAIANPPWSPRKACAALASAALLAGGGAGIVMTARDQPATITSVPATPAPAPRPEPAPPAAARALPQPRAALVFAAQVRLRATAEATGRSASASRPAAGVRRTPAGHAAPGSTTPSAPSAGQAPSGGSAPSGGPAPSAVSVMSFNVCGAVCHRGEVRRTAAYTAGAVVRRRTSIVLLQELCFSQFVRIRTLVARHGYTTSFAASSTSGACDDDDRHHGKGFGVATLVRGKAWNRVVEPLPTRAGYEKRVLLGLTTQAGGRPTFVANVHLSPSAEAGLDAQLGSVSRYLDRTRSLPTIVGGDFNALPDHPGMARFYTPRAGGTGRFVELDETTGGRPARSGEATFDVGGRKLDYVFVSAAHFGAPSADSAGSPMSDHRVYRGTAQPTWP